MAIERNKDSILPKWARDMLGTEAEETSATEIEIGVVNPEAVYVETDGMEMALVEDEGVDEFIPFDANLAEYMSETDLEGLSTDLIENIDADIISRQDWADTFVKGLDVLGLKYEERSEPWEDACGVFSTLLSEAVIRFQAETMSETFPAAGPVRTKILGKEDREKVEAAARVQADMNYELTDNMVEYRPEHERMLYSLGLAGSAFKKVYFDPQQGRQVAIFVPAEDVLVPYGSSNIETSERVTHVMRKTENEMAALQNSGFYRDVELGEPVAFHSDIEEKKAEGDGFSLTNDNRYAIYEVHADLVLDFDEFADGLAKPYIVSIERGTGEVLAVRRNWDPDDALMKKQQYFVHYVYIPGFGFYGLGLIHIIGGYAKAGTSLIRQLVDAGTLSNLPGGLKTRGLRVKGDDSPIEPGEFRDVDVPSGSIRDNIMTLPYKEPSQTLLTLLDRITQEGRRLGAISDINVADMSANAPVGTTLALLERTLKPMAAVQARVHYAMKLEFKLLKNIIAKYSPDEYMYIPHRGETAARRVDYEMVEVIPVSDPNASTMAQRVVQYQAVLQMAQQAPQIYDLPQLHRQMLEVLGIKNADKLIPLADDAKPVDPISENMNALVGKPLKAFLYQDHKAHIAAHMSFMKDPMVAQMIGQNPQAQQIMTSLQAHIAEHLGFLYRSQIEERLGATLPAPGEEMPEDMEVQLSRLVADAAQQLTQVHSQEAAQQKAAQQAQDPVMQMKQAELQLKQAELQLKQAELQRKAQKDQADTQLSAAELQRKAGKDQADAQLEAAEIKRKAEKDKVDANVDARELELEKQKLAMEARKPK